MATGITQSQLAPGVQTVYQAAITLTDAQIKAWDTTPITLVAAPGAGRVVFPHSLVLSITSTEAYTNRDANCYIATRWDTNLINSLNTAEDKTNLSNILTSGDNEIWLKEPLVGAASQAADADSANLPLKLWMENGAAGDLTGGDAANELTITLNYSIAAF